MNEIDELLRQQGEIKQKNDDNIGSGCLLDGNLLGKVADHANNEKTNKRNQELSTICKGIVDKIVQGSEKGQKVITVMYKYIDRIDEKLSEQEALRGVDQDFTDIYNLLKSGHLLIDNKIVDIKNIRLKLGIRQWRKNETNGHLCVLVNYTHLIELNVILP